MASQRRDIVDKVQARLDTYFGAEGSDEAMFRAVRRGPLRPVKMTPSCTVSDSGQRSANPYDDESEGLLLRIRITAHLAENWEDVDAAWDWTDRMEKLRVKLNNWLPDHCGMLKMKYIDDDPLDVIWTSGATQAVWVMEMEATYFTEAEGPADWD